MNSIKSSKFCLADAYNIMKPTRERSLNGGMNWYQQLSSFEKFKMHRKFNTLEADMFVVKPIVSCMQGHATSKALELYTSLMRDCKPRSYHLFSFSIYRLILIGFSNTYFYH